MELPDKQPSLTAGIPKPRPCCSNALKTRLSQLGFDLPDEQLNDVFKRFKNLADRKKVSFNWPNRLMVDVVRKELNDVCKRLQIWRIVRRYAACICKGKSGAFLDLDAHCNCWCTLAAPA